MIVAADNLHAANPAVAQALKDLGPKPLQSRLVSMRRPGVVLDFRNCTTADRLAFRPSIAVHVPAFCRVIPPPAAEGLVQGHKVG